MISLPKRIPELDGLRAIAVLLVIVFHMMEFSGALPGKNHWIGEIMTSYGRGGVHLFFVISGFIITRLLLEEQQHTGRVSLRAFYTRRFFRILPPYATYLLVIFLLGHVGYLSTKPQSFWWSILFLTNWDVLGGYNTAGMWFVAHTWSLSVEEQYYLILPPVMVLVFKLRRWPTTLLISGVLGLCLVSVNTGYTLAERVNPSWVKIIWLYRFRYILVGVLMALHKQAIERVVRDVPVVVPMLGIGYIALAATFAQTHGLLYRLGGLVETVDYGFLVVWVLANADRCAVLRWRWLQWVGGCSYSIYLWQQLFTGPAEYYDGWTVSPWLISIVPIFGCAALSYYLVERPTIRVGRVVSGKLLARQNSEETKAVPSHN